MTVQNINAVAWTVWYVTWIAAVVFSSRTRVQKGSDLRSPGRILMGIGLLLIITPGSVWRRAAHATPMAWLAWPVWPAPAIVNWVLFGLVLAGFAFCWWARLHLGRLWSGLTTLKEGHYIVDTGPYGIVRHPIYTGIIFSALMTAALSASILGAIGVVSLTIGLAMVATLEEAFLREQLGPEAYDAYAARVPMLVPKWIGVRRRQSRLDG